MKEYIPQFILLLLSGGLLTGIYMLLKLRPEAGQITVTAAQGAVVVQTGVIESLREDLLAVRIELKEVRKELKEARIHLATAIAENEGLRFRLRALEKKS